MADDKQVDFQDGVTAVTEAWLDRMQEVQQGLGWNLNLAISGTSVVLNAGTLENVASIVIKGKMRLVSSPLSINFTGSPAGSYGIWANTTATDSSPTFTLQAVQGTSAPAGVTYTRKIATVSWSGTALSNLVLLAPYVKHSQMHVSGGADPLPQASVGTSELANNSVTNPKIADNAVDGLNFTDDVLQRVIQLGKFSSTEVVWLPNAPGQSGTATRGQAVASTGSYENVGRRTALGSDIGASAGTHMIPVTFGNMLGLKRQIRMMYVMSYGGQAGIVGANLTVRDFSYPTFSIVWTPSSLTNLNTITGATAWVDADNVGFTASGTASAEDFRIVTLEALGNAVGNSAYWVIHFIVFQGRYSRV